MMPHIPAFAVADWLRSEFGSKQAHNQTGEGSGYYKFMHRRDTHFITEDHTLLLKSAAVYRKSEGDWIADPLEQTAMVDIQNYSPSRMPGNTVDRIGPGLGFSGDSRQSIISGITLVYHAKDLFVLCFSYGNYKELARKMLHRPPENYDGCVRIKDAKLLAELIYRTGETELGAVCDLFEKPIAGKVKYAAMRREAGQSRYTPPGPLVKTDKHAAQKEYRIALMPRRSLDVESVSIKIKPPPDLFTLWGEIWHR